MERWRIGGWSFTVDNTVKESVTPPPPPPRTYTFPRFQGSLINFKCNFLNARIILYIVFAYADITSGLVCVIYIYMSIVAGHSCRIIVAHGCWNLVRTENYRIGISVCHVDDKGCRSVSTCQGRRTSSSRGGGGEGGGWRRGEGGAGGGGGEQLTYGGLREGGGRGREVGSPMSNVQAVYLIILVDPHPKEDIRAFSVVVLTSIPLSRAHYCSIPKDPLTLTEYNPSCSCSVD